MRIKDSFELIKDKSGRPVPNVLPIRSNTLSAFEVDEDDIHHLQVLAKGYSRAHGGGGYVVRMPDYPLPGFVTKDGIPVINLSVLPSEYVSDYAAPDIYSMYLYALTLRSFVKRKPFDKNIEIHIANYYIAAFMKFYSKKHGLQGSYKHLIPNLQLIIALYVHAGIMGGTINRQVITKLSNRYFPSSPDELNLTLDLSTTIGFLNTLKINNIIPVSENSFSQTIINTTGLSGVPAYEDGSRFFATMAASSISGSAIFSSFFRKINRQIYEKLVYMALQNIKKG
jgi:hypothetical protein